MWGVTAIVAITTKVVGDQVIAHKQRGAQRDAERDAREQAKIDRAEAIKAEEFADTEGEGIGQLGTIHLALDDTINEDELLGKSNISL